MIRFGIPLVMCLAIGVFLYRGLGLSPGYVPSPFIGKPAPEFLVPRLSDLSAQTGNADMLGRISLFNVWGTWCGGCREEHDLLMRISQATDVPIYGLNWKDDRRRALTWLSELGNPYAASGYDAEGFAAIDWGVYGAPETFLIDADGTVLYKHIAPLTEGVWYGEFVPRILERCGEDPCPLLGDI